MFDHILVALDGSELAERALPMAENLARNSNATIHLIQVVSRQPELQATRGGRSRRLSQETYLFEFLSKGMS